MFPSLRPSSRVFDLISKVNTSRKILPSKPSSFTYSFRYSSTRTYAQRNGNYDSKQEQVNEYPRYNINGENCDLSICYMRPKFTENSAWMRVSKKGQLFLDFYPKNTSNTNTNSKDIKIDDVLIIPPLAPPPDTNVQTIDSISFTLSISEMGELITNLNQDLIFEVSRRKPGQRDTTEKSLRIMSNDDDTLLFSVDFLKDGVGSQPIPRSFSSDKFLDKNMVGPWEIISKKGEKEIFLSIINKSILQLSGWDVCLRGKAFHDLEMKENERGGLDKSRLIL